MLSNTVVQEDALYVGSPIVAHLNRLREQPPLPLSALLRMSADDPQLRREEQLITFDASAWAFVHFVLFADNGSRGARFDKLATLLQRGANPAAAVEESFGAVEKLQDEYGRYVSRTICSGVLGGQEERPSCRGLGRGAEPVLRPAPN